MKNNGFGYLNNSALSALTQNPLVHSPFSQYYNVVANSAPTGWDAWNGSGDTPYTNLGFGYGGSIYASISCVPIDANRFLLIAGGHNQDISYTPATVTVVTITGGIPSYGIPVNLDADSIADSGNVWFRGLKISDGKVYINYGWLPGSFAFTNYAKICNIANDGTITFGTRSVNIGTTSGASATIPCDLSLSSNGHVYHVYNQSDSNNIFLCATTINNDDSITVGTPKDMGISVSSTIGIKIACLNVSDLFFTGQNNVYVAPSTGTTIGNIAASLQIYGSGLIGFGANFISKINDSQIVMTFDNYTILGEAQVKASIVTYDNIGFSLSQGTQLLIDHTSTNYVFPFEINQISATQAMLYYLSQANSNMYGEILGVVVNESGTSLTKDSPVAINANGYVNNFGNYLPMQSAVMSNTQIATPYFIYNCNAAGTAGNYGVTIVNQANKFTLPKLLFRLKAGLGLLNTQPISLVNGNGTAGATSLTVSGDVTSSFVVGMGFYEASNSAHSHVVTSSSYSAPNTTVNFTTPLYGNLVNTALTFTGLYQWQASSGFFSDVIFANMGIGEKLYLGQLNGQPTIIATNTEDSSYLTSSAIASISDAQKPVSVLATDFTLFIVCKMSSGQIIDMTNDANVYPAMSMNISGGVNTTGLYFSQTMTFGNSPNLAVITIVRQSGNMLAYVNKEAAASNNAEILALGSDQIFYLFNASNGLSPGLGYISDVQLWAGALSAGQIGAIQDALIAQYSIS